MGPRNIICRESNPLFLFDTLNKDNLDEFKETDDGKEMIFRFFCGKNQKKNPDHRLTNVENRVVPPEERYLIHDISFSVWLFTLDGVLFSFNVGNYPVIFDIPILYMGSFSGYRHRIEFNYPVKIERNQHYDVSIRIKKEIFRANSYKNSSEMKCVLSGETETERVLA